MALNVDILSVNSLFINGVDILSNKRDYVELVGDEKIVIDVPSATYAKAIPQSGVNLGDVELKTTPLDGKTFDSINNAGGVSVDGVSHIVDVNGCYVSNINIDSFVLNKTSVIKSLDYTTYKWHDVDYGRYDLVLSCDSLSEIGSNGLINFDTRTLNILGDSSCIAHYSFNGNSNDSGGLYNLTSTNVSFINGGIKGTQCAKFSSNSVMNLNNLVNLNNLYTVSFWIDSSSIIAPISTDYSMAFLPIIKIGTPSIMYISLSKDSSGNIIIWTYTYSGTVKKRVLPTPYNSWIHIAISTNTIYVNGIESSTNLSGGTSAQYSTSLTITGATSQFNIDDLRIFNKVLNASEVLSIYNDLSVPDKVGVLVSTDFQTGTASYEFNGTSYITAPSNTKYVLGVDDFTIELYTKVKYLDATYGTTILDNRPDNTNGLYWVIGMTKDGFLNINTNNTNIITGTTNQFNKWCHIALVRKDGVTSLYVNGIKEGSTSTLYSYSGDTFKIGRNAFYPTVPLLQGLIDDLRITKGLARYTTNFTPSTTLDTGTRPVKTIQHQGTVIQSELSYSDYLVSYGAEIDPWVAVQPAITVSGEPFTTAVTSITSSNTFTSAETFNIGDIISSDKETFGTVIFEENGEFMVDADIFFDGVTDKPFTPSDANIVNFVKDKRSNLYTNGLRDALLSSVSSTIYGHINDEIIVDAGEGGSFILGTMYTSGGYQDTDTTSKFSISLSNDGVDYTVVYENQENLMTNHTHNMTGTGRFIKITFLNEMGDWGRIITNFVGGKWWDLHIVHPMSKVYRYAARLEVNGKSIVPNYIQWFDNMTINKIVCDKVFINPTTVLNINTENISKVELDLWQEVKGVI